jgi:hypothetical protein
MKSLSLILLISITCIYGNLNIKSSDEDPVKLILDVSWFRSQASRGCCPYAHQMYVQRYSEIENRCCSSRLMELMPLKAKGGMDFQVFLTQVALRKKNLTVLFQGDSMAEQHYVGLLCFAWYSKLNVTLFQTVGDANTQQMDNTQWEAIIEKNFVLKLLRWNYPSLSPHINYASDDYLVVGGWHHGSPSFSEIKKFIYQLQKLRPTKSVIVTEALPNHFPGGKYSVHGNYSQLNGSFMCQKNNFVGDPDINDMLHSQINDKNFDNVHILSVAKYFTHRGAANIGPVPEGIKGPSVIDCLHYCIAPGVWDAASRQTLSLISKIENS